MTIRLTWEGKWSRAILDGKGLLGPLAIQVAFAVAATSGVAVCTSCDAAYPYPRGDRPWERRNYCDQCMESGEAHKYATQEYMRRRRSS